MRVNAIWIAAVVAPAIGCGAARSHGPVGPSGEAERNDPCPNRNELQLASHCWNPAGSRWRIVASAPGGEHRFDIELLSANRLRSSDHPAADPARDEWFVENGELRLFLANRFVEYHAHVSNGTVLVGRAVNARGDEWRWRGDRSYGTGCPEGEAQLSAGCFSIAGTVWDASRGDVRHILQFAEDGQLLVDADEADAEHRWTQEGALVHFAHDGHDQTVVIASDAAHFAGEGWTGELVPLYPPPPQ